MSAVDPTWLSAGGMLVGALLGIVLTALLARAQTGRWRCRGCLHPYTVHITPAGAPAPCGHGLGLVCGCRVYMGKPPPARLLRVAEAPEDTELAPPPAATP
jgi:hypothetical protein